MDGVAGVTLFGDGFYLPPKQSGVLVFNVNEWGTTGSAVYGVFGDTFNSKLEVSIEYLPRYLYV